MKKLFTLIFTLSLTFNTTFAALPVVDIAAIPNWIKNLSFQLADSGFQIFNGTQLSMANIKTYALDPAAFAIGQKIKDQIKAQIIKWVQGGGSGKPQFLDNPETFFTNIATQQLTLIKNDLIRSAGVGNSDVIKLLTSGNAEGAAAKAFQNAMTPTVGKDIQSDICTGDRLKNMAGGDAAKESALRAQYCSAKTSSSTQDNQLKDLQNCFAKDFACGGWGAFLSITQKPYQNTETGRLTVAQLQLQQKQEVVTTKTNNELNRGGGFFSQKVCKPGKLVTKDGKGEDLLPSEQICTEYETVTPGQQLSRLTSSVLDDPIKQLQNADTIGKIITSVLLMKLSGAISGAINTATGAAAGGLKNLTAGDVSTGIRSASSSDNSADLRGSVAAAGKPTDPNITGVTLSPSEQSNMTTPILQLMRNTLKEHVSNITVVQNELDRYTVLIDKITKIEQCYNASQSVPMPQIVSSTIATQKPILANKILSLADEMIAVKDRSADLEAAIETLSKSNDVDSINNIFMAFSRELSANKYLTSAVAEKRKLDNADLYTQLDQLGTTFDSMLTECQNGGPGSQGGNGN